MIAMDCGRGVPRETFLPGVGCCRFAGAGKHVHHLDQAPDGPAVTNPAAIRRYMLRSSRIAVAAFVRVNTVPPASRGPGNLRVVSRRGANVSEPRLRNVCL